MLQCYIMLQSSEDFPVLENVVIKCLFLYKVLTLDTPSKNVNKPCTANFTIPAVENVCNDCPFFTTLCTTHAVYNTLESLQLEILSELYC